MPLSWLAASSLWLVLAGQFALLSLLAIGGAISVAPEMHRVFVGELHLLSDAQFAQSIALAQAAPGPNVLFVAVLGFQMAGLGGAVASMVGILLPSTTLAMAATRWSRTREHLRGVQAFKAGLAPLTLGLTAATAWLLAPTASATPNWSGMALAAAVAILVWRTRVHLLVLLASGAALGALGWV